MLCYMQHASPVNASCWSSDGVFLATVSALGVVSIFDSRTFGKSGEVATPIQTFVDAEEQELEEVRLTAL